MVVGRREGWNRGKKWGDEKRERREASHLGAAHTSGFELIIRYCVRLASDNFTNYYIHWETVKIKPYFLVASSDLNVLSRMWNRIKFVLYFFITSALVYAFSSLTCVPAQLYRRYCKLTLYFQYLN